MVREPGNLFHGISACAQIIKDRLAQLGVRGEIIEPSAITDLIISDRRFARNVYILHYEPGYFCEGLEKRIWNRSRIAVSFCRACRRLHALNCRFGVIVHEFYSAELLVPGAFLSRRLDAWALRRADFCIVSQEWVAEELLALGCRDVRLQAVFSNLPDPTRADVSRERDIRVVCFGSSGAMHRLATNSNIWQRVADKLHDHQVTIVANEVSSGVRDRLQELFSRCTVSFLIGASNEQISQEMSRARIGLVDYSHARNPPDSFKKSGVLAAFLQHAVTPIVLGQGGVFFGLDMRGDIEIEQYVTIHDMNDALAVNSFEFQSIYFRERSVDAYIEKVVGKRIEQKKTASGDIIERI